MSSMTTTNAGGTADLLDLAERMARAAGAELMSRYGNIQGLGTKSSATDPVSDADRAAEALVAAMLLEQRPQRDGPMLLHGLQGRHGQPLMSVPRSRVECPDPQLLRQSYERFRAGRGAG